MVKTRTMFKLYSIVSIVVIATLSFSTISYFYKQKENTKIMSEKNVRIQDYEDLITSLRQQLDANKEFIRVLRKQNGNTNNSFSNIEAMVATATQNITDIKKLEETDKELLAKYSKIYFLNEHYTPHKLAVIPTSYTGGKDLQIESQVEPFLIDMLNDMKRNGLSPLVISAYRSFSYQKDLKHRNAVTYGEGTANQFVADQGYSEHQLGTAVDISTHSIGGSLGDFKDTLEYTWLLDNAYKYGFIISYPKSNEYYAFESWHWRFVGIDLATRLNEKGMHFYDMPQREIDTYRLKMFNE